MLVSSSYGYQRDKLAINPATGEIVRLYSTGYDTGTIFLEFITINPVSMTITRSGAKENQAANRITQTAYIFFDEPSGKYLFAYQTVETYAGFSGYNMNFRILTTWNKTTMSLGPAYTTPDGPNFNAATQYLSFTYGGRIHRLVGHNKFLVEGLRLPAPDGFFYGYFFVIDISSGSMSRGQLTAPAQTVTDSYAGSTTNIGWAPLMNKYIMDIQLSNSFNEDRWDYYFTIEDNKLVIDPESADLRSTWGDPATSNFIWMPEYNYLLKHHGRGYSQTWRIYGGYEGVFWTNFIGQTERL